jgi:hypothetical protein
LRARRGYRPLDQHEVETGPRLPERDERRVVRIVVVSACGGHRRELDDDDRRRQRGAAFAHILVCFLAYVLWKTLAQWQQRAGLGSSPRLLLDELRTIQSTVVLPLASDAAQELRIRCVVRALLDRPGLRLPERLPLTPAGIGM